MTNFERITNMSADEIAEAAVFELRIFIIADPTYMSQLDATCYSTRELAVAHNKEWLAREVESAATSMADRRAELDAHFVESVRPGYVTLKEIFFNWLIDMKEVKEQ